MSRITQRPAVAPLNPFAPTTVNQVYGSLPGNAAPASTGTGFADASFISYVGQKFDTSDGRELVLVQNGTTALVSGVLVQEAAPIAAFSTTAVAITVPTAYPATAGAYQILATNGSTVLNANQYQGGLCIVSAGTGIGQSFKIASHQAAIASATFVITLEDPIQVTLDATSKVNLHYNPYGGGMGSGTTGVSAGVIINPTTSTGAVLGATICPVAASTAATFTAAGVLSTAGVNQYALIVCHGPAAVLNDSAATTVAGEPASCSTATAGAVCLTTVAKGIVGNARVTGLASTTIPVYLTL